jgi:co-chaperonin GroES (HSP10)
MTKIIAAKTRVLFTKKDVEKTTSSGIVLSNPTEVNPLGTVSSIGSDVAMPDLAVGDKISVNWQSVGMLEHEGAKYYIVDQNNINAIIKD